MQGGEGLNNRLHALAVRTRPRAPGAVLLAVRAIRLQLQALVLAVETGLPVVDADLLAHCDVPFPCRPSECFGLLHMPVPFLQWSVISGQLSALGRVFLFPDP
jgi:hypothetical protein